jgi:hypothetical protein
MNREYKIRFFQNSTYEVIEIVTTNVKRTSEYDSEPSTVEENTVYQGGLADCEAYIRLHEGEYM